MSTYLDQRKYEIGDTIFAEGDTGSEIFIVQSGTVAVMKDFDGRPVFLAMLERGDFFGEMALLDGQRRSATCYALTPTTLVAIKSAELLLKLRRDPTFALEMLQTLSRRIRRLNEQLVKLMEDRTMSAPELTKVLARSEYRSHDQDR